MLQLLNRSGPWTHPLLIIYPGQDEYDEQPERVRFWIQVNRLIQEFGRRKMHKKA